MTSLVVITVTQNQDPSAAVVSPSGKGQGLTRFQILDASGAVVDTLDLQALTASFSGVPDGDFTATAQLLDTDGNTLGELMSKSFHDGAETPPAAATFQPLNAIDVQVSQE